MLDSPQHLQLHAAIDLYSSVPSSLDSTPSSNVFWLDREVISQSLERILKDNPGLDDVKTRRLQDIKEEGWDLFLRVVESGDIIITAIAVITRASSPPNSSLT